jgi:hypothetical protein
MLADAGGGTVTDVGAGAGLGGAEAGAEGFGTIGAGEGGFSGATAGAGGSGAGSGITLGDLQKIPTGVGQFGNADAGAGFEDYINGGSGTMEGTASAGAEGGSGFDWSKFLSSGSGSIWPQLLGSGIGALASWLGSQAQVKSAEEANQLLWAMYQQNRADLAPYREAAIPALGNLTKLTTPGEKVGAMQMDPGYRWRLGQGEQAIDRALASRGVYDSGRALKELTRYGQGFASNEFGNVFNRNAALAGIGQTAVNTGVNASNFTGGNVANNITGAGNATASGYVGAGNAITGGLQGYINQQNQDRWLEAILAAQQNKPYG